MSKPVTDAVRSLQKAKEAAKTRLVTLEAERLEIKGSLKSLDAALKALQKKTAKDKPARPAATTAEVIELLTKLLADKQELAASALEQKLGEMLLASGKSRMGLKLRLKQALNDKQFKSVAGKVRLAVTEHPAKQ